jgi:hypothetical protein
MPTIRFRLARAAALTSLAASIPLLAGATRATTPMFGGPWISVEAPVNPYDESVRGALFLVHTFHHGYKVNLPLSGTAEGLVDGQRKSVALTMMKSAELGTRGVRNEWGVKGTWTVLVTAKQGEIPIQAVVEIDADGSVGRISIPKEPSGKARTLSVAEIDRGLRERAAAPTRLSGR